MNLDARIPSGPIAENLIRDVGITGHLRVTAGTPDETDAFLDALAAALESEAS